MAFSVESRPSWSNKPFKSCVGESIFISLLVTRMRDLRCGFIASEGAALQEFDSDVRKQE
jgi:hypothetical protein